MEKLKKVETPKVVTPKEPKYSLVQLKPHFTGIEFDFLQVYIDKPVTIKEAKVILEGKMKGAVK